MATPVAEWTTFAEVQAEVGSRNLDKLRDLDNTRNVDSMDAVLQNAMTAADQIVNQYFTDAGYTLPLTPLPNGRPLPLKLIRLAAAKIVHWQLYNQKGRRDNDAEGDHLTEKYLWATDWLERLAQGRLDAVLEEPEAGPVNQVGQIRTLKFKKKECPKPATDEFAREPGMQ